MQSTIVELDADSFTNLIVKNNRLGYGFVPFVGSGISAPSGVLMGMEFAEYLAYTIYRVVADKQEKGRWDLRRNGWPKQPSTDDVAVTLEWFKKCYAASCERCSLEVQFDENHEKVKHFEFKKQKSGNNADEWYDLSKLALTLGRPLIPEILKGAHLWEADDQLRGLFDFWDANDRSFAVRNLSPDSQEQIEDRAMRAASEWRSTLLFLSRVRMIADDRIVLAESDPAVIDAFNVHITRDKQPCLGHKMLAHLMRSLRARVMLTTNFDNLLETSLQNILHDVNVIPVSAKGQLPDPKTVFAKDCIIKLHGSMLETRADFSLDDMPELDDQQRFAQYLGAQRDHFEKNRPLPSHLLVVGYSGSDRRCLQMIKHSLERMPEQELFWICFRKEDSKKLDRDFPEEAFQTRIHKVIANRPDLLLYQLYQRLNYSLPSGGFSYQFTARVPPQRESRPDEKAAQRVADLLKRFEMNPGTDFTATVDQVTAGLASDERFELQRCALIKKISTLIVDSIVGAADLEKKCKPFENYFAIERKPIHTEFLQKDREAREYPGVTIVRHRSGSIDAAHACIPELETRHRKKVVWLEQQDFTDVFSMMHDALTGIAIQVGSFQLEHVAQLPKLDLDDLSAAYAHCRTGGTGAASQKVDEKYPSVGRLARHLDRFVSHLGLKASEWVIMVYGRTAPGACSGWGGDQHLWSQQQFEAQWTLYQCWLRAGFHVVYFPFDQARHKAEAKRKEILDDELRLLRAEFRGKEIPDKDRWTPAEAMPLPDRFTTDVTYFEKGKSDTTTQWSDGIRETSPNYKRIIHSVTENWIRTWCNDPILPYDKQPDERAQEALLRFWFIYSLTLFRQSRHVSAFYIDGVYRCPFRFNLLGLDNDWIRATKVQAWIAELRMQHVFYEKAGGFSWMHRDVRLGIQKICESLCIDDILKNKDKQYGNGAQSRRYPINFRSGMHHSIGEWYLKAFLTNGHWVPAIECLYHLLMSARHAYLANPASFASQKISRAGLRDFRTSVLKNSLTDLCKTLMLVRPYMQFWLSDPNGFKMLPKFRSYDGSSAFELDEASIREILDGAVENLELANRREISDEIKELKNRCMMQIGVIGNEIIEGKTTSERRYVDWFELMPARSRSGEPFCTALETNVVDGKGWEEPWFEFFERRGAKFVRLAVDAARNPGGRGAQETLESKVRQDRAIWASSGRRSPGDVYEVVEAIGELAYLFVRRTKRDYHENDARYVMEMEPWKKKKRGKYVHQHLRPHYFSSAVAIDEWNACVKSVRTGWLAVTVLCNNGLAICKSLDPMFLQREISLRSKLHTLYGLALANLDRFFEAHRHLTEATAYLSKSADGLKPLPLAIVRIRRAEVYLTEALRIADFFAQAFDQLCAKGRDSWRKIVESWDVILEGQLNSVATGLVADRYFKEMILAPKSAKEPRKAGIVLSVNDEPDDFQYARIPARVLEVLRSLKKRDVSQGKAIELKELVNALFMAELAALDDAAAAIDQAERNLSGRSQHSLWWGRLYAIRLRIYSAESDLNRRAKEALDSSFHGLVRRKPVQHDAIHFEIYRRGILSTVNSPYRQLRIMDYYLDCIRANNEIDGTRSGFADQLKVVEEDFKALPEDELSEVSFYRELVAWKLKKK